MTFKVAGEVPFEDIVRTVCGIGFEKSFGRLFLTGLKNARMNARMRMSTAVVVVLLKDLVAVARCELCFAEVLI